ncbi:Uma2 family endonuclease [Pseudonocardia sp. KRD-184]|uniref:Uma2 family endonuclease n=1 Tax=Pseudonocardia oceani TaxID=2792013 RepID=A0ABS6UB36_9PSEU|nr:Uma2 family endonuclease [Pseudonocardia oceani]MBW0089781.1 Uma2 family endonuclease [Pseudonocardia oceani]MBW0094621.1 Uma2 family endonuclease [Pseudonocardia oceani]MBW0109478.1 Uma2 family endonuclease [Pseudonocardia oceani]MBW0119889.1 Uma2 family endonuclease [Pseudonocardia oceani]MBW0129452.1 Uma2 family endonuclease [Pseudonocardia oceani]
MAHPSAPPRLLTVAEYLELGEIEPGYSELIEGRVVITPSPLADHNWVAAEMRDQLKPQLPPDLVVILDIDVDLQLAAPDRPGFVRRPDLIVVQRDARLRQRHEGGLIRASEVVIVVEVLSPGSGRTDNVAKRAEYADAGIPHYWVLDPEEPVSLLACHLAGEFGYADGGAVQGSHRTDRPFPLVLDLDALL